MISYSLYLWHYFVFWLMGWRAPIVALAFSLGVAALCYHKVQRPLRKHFRARRARRPKLCRHRAKRSAEAKPPGVPRGGRFQPCSPPASPGNDAAPAACTSFRSRRDLRWSDDAGCPVEHGGVKRLGYVPALDGVRGLLVPVIVAFHYSGYPSGAFFSMEFFFALSGFLITSLLLEERDRKGRISLWSSIAGGRIAFSPACSPSWRRT